MHTTIDTKKIVYFLIIFMCLVIVYSFYSHKSTIIYNFLSTNNSDYNNNIILSFNNDGDSNYFPQNNNNTIKYIYLWNAMFDRTWYLYKTLVKPIDFEKFKCSAVNCVVTTNVSILSDITLYDAILFHAARKWSLSDIIPSERNSNQLYVVSILESPSNTDHDLKGNADFFNLTLTYRFGGFLQ